MRERLGFGRRSEARSPAAFAVVSLETTGLFPAYHHRIIEIAILNVQGDRVIDEWETLVNPERDIGPTRVHGISARQVADAPTFRDVAGDIADRLGGRMLVGHNGRFQADFLDSEMHRLSKDGDWSEVLCTMTLTAGLGLAGRSLGACCESVGLARTERQDALSDARATAGLLAALLRAAHRDDRELRLPAVMELGGLADLPRTGRTHRRGRSGAAPPSILARLADRLPADTFTVQAAPEALLAYVSLLDRVLEDRQLDEAEVEALGNVANRWGLSASAVDSIHERFFAGIRALALEADRLADGVCARSVRFVNALGGAPRRGS